MGKLNEGSGCKREMKRDELVSRESSKSAGGGRGGENVWGNDAERIQAQTTRKPHTITNISFVRILFLMSAAERGWW